MVGSSHKDKFDIHKLGTLSPKQRKGQLRSSQSQSFQLKVTTVTGCFYLKHIQLRKYYVGLFLHFGPTNIMQNAGYVSKLLSIFWVFVRLKNFGLGLRKFLLGLMYFGSHLDTS